MLTALKLYVLFNGTTPSEPELVMESDDRDALNETGRELAKEICGSHHPVLIWSGHRDGDEELIVEGHCRFVIRK